MNHSVPATDSSIPESESSPSSDAALLKPHQRIFELDALRAMAAINLVLFHFTWVYSEKFGYVDSLGWRWPFGAYGVELFFMLSGFVNSMSLLRRGRPVDFVAARLIRIVPIFLVVIVANLAILTLPPLNSHPISVGQFVANLTLMPRVFGYECIDPVMWTLQVEMMFYGLLVALFLSGGLRRYFLGWGTLLILSVTLCPTLDALRDSHGETPWFAVATAIRQLLVLDHAPLFAIGFLLYMIKTGVGRKSLNFGMIFLAAGVFHCIDHGKHNPLATALIFGLVTLAAYGRIPILRMKPFVFISTISYAVYLCHNNLGCALIYRFNQSGVSANVCFFIAVLFSFAVGILVTRRLEQPMTRRLREAWERYRGQPKAVLQSGKPAAAAD